MARSEELTFIQKRYLVQRLACHDTPSEAAAAFKTEFGFEVARNRVAYYDPTTKTGAALPAELKTIFEETRKAFLDDLDSIPIANKAVRLRHLQKQLEYFAGKNAAGIVMQLCEAAAKEIGGSYTNKLKLEHTGKDGGPIQVANAARERVFRRLDDLRERIEGRVAGLAADAGADRAPEGVGGPIVP